jgi:hypothetical protein
MATNINTILNWFKTGLKPTQAQFWASWTSFWHKDEMIPQSSVSDLTMVLNAKVEKDQFDAHKTDMAAHSKLFAKAKVYELGEMQVFKKKAAADVDYIEGQQPGDYCVGAVFNENEEVELISADYLGGNITRKSSYDI